MLAARTLSSSCCAARLLVCAALKEEYNVLESTSGAEGLAKAHEKRPDLTLLDMLMPGMDGFAVARELKKDEKTRTMPIIALTAKAMKGDKQKILEAGCNDYISKPIDVEAARRKIRKWFEKGRNLS